VKQAEGWGLCHACRKTLAVAVVVVGVLLALATGVAGKQVAVFTSGGLVILGAMGLAATLVFDKIEGRR